MSEKDQIELLESNNNIQDQNQNIYKNETDNTEQNKLNKNIPKKNIIYQKPTKKQNDYNINNNSYDYYVSNNDYDNKNNIYLEEHSETNSINKKTFKDNKIKEISNNLKENEVKLEKVNKTMIDLLNNKNKNKKDEINNSSNNISNIINNTKSFTSQINEIEKINQENLTLKADLIIYREDIIHLSEINKKLKEELEKEKRKIYDLIAKGEESLHILTNKNYEINQLTETISNLKLSNSTEVMDNIKDNRTKDQIIYEKQLELENLKNDQIRIQTEKKMLEEQYKNILKEKKGAEKEEEIRQEIYNSNKRILENKIKNMEKQLEELKARNNELKINNQKINSNIERVKNEEKYFENEYQKKKREYNELDDEFKQLENKYAQMLYDIQKQKFMKEKIKNKYNFYKKKIFIF